MTELAAAPSEEGPLATFVALSRLHIIAIASLACLTFGWLLSGGQRLWMAAALCAIDWFIVNLVNRVADLAEDRANGIAGTDLVAAHGRAFELACAALLVGSLVGVHLWNPSLTPWRVGFHAIGLAYNYKLLPGPRGRTRFKELYFFKNFSSAVLFIISTIAYPLALAGAHPAAAYVGLLAAFFLPLEITYEIIYDLRDVDGDRALGVPTFPVVHGAAASARIIDALLVLSSLALVAGAALGIFHLKETCLIAAPIQQALYFHLRLKAAPTKARCIFITWLGASQVLAYQLWIAAGLPLDLPGWH